MAQRLLIMILDILQSTLATAKMRRWKQFIKIIDIPSFSSVQETHPQRPTIIKFDMSITHGFVIFCLFAGTSSYSRFRRENVVASCPSVETFSGFNQTKYMGTWYSHGMFNPFNITHGQCNTQNWTAVQNGELSIVETYFEESADGNITKNMFTARVLDPSKPERFRVCMHDQNNYCSTNSILKTDYISYSVEHFCELLTRDDGDISVPEIRIMTRKRNVPKAAIDKAMKFIRRRGFNTGNDYMETNQASCK